MAFLSGNTAAKKEFDWEMFDSLCSYPDVITQPDIAEIMKVSVDTCANKVRELHDCTFSEYRVKKQAGFRQSVLSWQLKAAKNGNVAMLIWIGKNYLNQKEPKTEQVLTIQDNDRLAKEYAAQLKELGFKGAQSDGTDPANT
jgi:hypothetical protein